MVLWTKSTTSLAALSTIMTPVPSTSSYKRRISSMGGRNDSTRGATDLGNLYLISAIQPEEI
jgi:hypothetical protein